MATPQRLPIVNSDDGSWGNIIRQFLMKEHVNDDSDSPNNGGHRNVTIQPGTATAAPLTLNSGPLLTTAAKGSIEFNNNSLYFTTTTGNTRKTVALYDDASGATGDLYYRSADGYFVRLGIGSGKQRLGTASGLPAWLDPDLALTTRAVSIDSTVAATDEVVFVNANANNVTLSLPAASSVAGQTYYFKRMDNSAYTVTIDPNGAETIDGYDTVTLGNQYTSIFIIAAGGLWYLLQNTPDSLSGDDDVIDGGAP